MAFRAYDRDGRIGPADRATLATTGALTLLACSLTVIPLYALARSSLSPTAAWATAAVWPVVPSAVLFQPSADTAFPLVSTLALTLAVQAVHRRALSSTILATACGATLGVGMQFSLVFLAAGLIVAVLSAAAAGTPVRRRVEVLAFTGVGFLAVTVLWWWYTGANPFEVWWFNQKNHSRFYVEYPRTFWVWALVNPVELAAGLGLPAAVWALMGLSRPRLVPVPALAAVLVLAILTLTGRNLSEVARLWLPFMPALLAALGAGLERLDAKAPAVGATVALVGLQTLFLQTLVQVVYPV